MKIESGTNKFYIGEDENEPMAQVKYRIDGENLYIDHVYVMSQLRGQGIAADLVESVIEFSKENELKIIPICSYAKSYISRMNND